MSLELRSALRGSVVGLIIGIAFGIATLIFLLQKGFFSRRAQPSAACCSVH
jgi:hypothetical protein